MYTDRLKYFCKSFEEGGRGKKKKLLYPNIGSGGEGICNVHRLLKLFSKE